MKTLIAENKSLKTQIQIRGNEKIKHYSEAKQMLKAIGIEIERPDEFAESFTNYAEKELKEQSKSFKYMDRDALFGLFKLDTKKLLRHELSFKANKIELVDNYTKLKPVDTSEYAETEEEKERLKIVQKLIEAVHEAEAIQGGKVNRLALCNSVPMLDSFNAQELKPSISWVKRGY